MSLEDIHLMVELLRARGPLPEVYDDFCGRFEERLRGAQEETGERDDLLAVMLPAVVHRIWLDRGLALYREGEATE